MANHMDCSNNCNALPQSGIYPPPIPTHMFSPTVPCYMVPHPETTMSSMLDMARQIATLELQLSIERERTAQLQQVNGFLLERLALAHITTATNSHSHIVGNGRGVGPINIDRPNGHASGDDLVNERGSIMSAVPAGRSTKIRTVDITSQREDANQHSHGVMSRDKRAAAIPEYSGPPQEQEVPRTARQQHIGATVHRRSDSACRMNHNKQDTKVPRPLQRYTPRNLTCSRTCSVQAQGTLLVVCLMIPKQMRCFQQKPYTVVGRQVNDGTSLRQTQQEKSCQKFGTREQLNLPPKPS